MSPTHPFQHRAAAFGLGAALTSTFGQSIFIGLFGAQVQQALGLPPSAWGALYGLATGVSGVSMFWLGQIADRVAASRVIVLALLVLATGAAAMALAQGPWSLAAAFLLLRLGGQGLCSHIAIVTAARHAERRGRNIAIAAFGFILGEALLPLIVTAVLGWIDWRWVWACAGAIVLFGALPLLHRAARPLPLRLTQAAGGNGTADDEFGMRRRDLLRHPTFLAALPVMLLFPFVVTSVFLHQGSISALRGWSAAQVAIAYLTFAGSQAVTTWLAGRLVDRSGAVPLFRFYLLPLAVGMLLGAFAPPDIAVWALYLGLGMGSGCQSVLSGALWAELFGIHRLGLVRGVFGALMVLSTAASPPLVGLALQHGVPLGVLAGGVAGYVLLVPWWLARWVRPVAAPPERV